MPSTRKRSVTASPSGTTSRSRLADARKRPTAPEKPARVGQRLDGDRQGLRRALDRPAGVEEALAREADAEGRGRDRQRPRLRREEELAQDREAPVALAPDRRRLARGRDLRPLEVLDPEAGELGRVLELEVRDGGLRVERVGEHERLADAQPGARGRRLHEEPGRGRAPAPPPEHLLEGVAEGVHAERVLPLRAAGGRALPATTSIGIAGAAWSPSRSAPTSAFPTARGCST